MNEKGTEASSLLAEIARAPLPEPLGGRVSRFLVLAGLCGEAIPADLLLEFLGVAGKDRDPFLDFLDQSLVERGLLEDLEYSHPSFPELAVYRFSSPPVARAALCLLPEPEVARLREELFSFLKASLEPQTQGACQLLLDVAPEWSRDERECLSRQLAWWIGEEEAAELEDRLAEELAAGPLHPESLWRVIEETADHWPAFRRLALLQAYERQPGGVPAWRAGEFHALRAIALHDSRHFQEALAEALTALGLLPDEEVRLRASCQALAGLVALETGQAPEARIRLAAVAEAAGTADVRPIADALRGLEPEELLRSTLEGALAISRRSRAFEQRRAADLWKSFADRLRQAENASAARLSLERALEVIRRFAGPRDLQLAITLKNLAEIHRSLGENLEAKARLEEALPIDASLFGESDEQVSILRNNLIDLSLETGDLNAARRYLGQALDTVRSTQGENSPEALVLLKHLADVLQRLGDTETALEILTEALAVEESLYGPTDPRVGAMLKHVSDLHGRLGNRDQFIACRLRSLGIEEAVYGAEDLRILKSLKILASSLREKGDQSAADVFSQRVQLIESRLVS